MLVQYLVGLCCLRWKPEVVSVTLGDLVYDLAAKKERDVDVTVTVEAGPAERLAFMGYEVKHEAVPLDVSSVEQMSAKLKDMKGLTHRAIVSTSGFTDGARSKASRHKITLYELLPWERPLEEQFPGLKLKGTVRECFPMSKYLLCWPEHRLSLFAKSAPGSFTVNDEDSLLSAKGRPHKKYKSFQALKHELLLRSSEILLALEPAKTVLDTFPIPTVVPEGQVAGGPAWPHTHTLDISQDQVFVQSASTFFQLEQVTISGRLQWQRAQDPAVYYVMQNAKTREAFAGALISTELRAGAMKALVFSPHSREIGIHFVQLAENHINMIRSLPIARPTSDA